MKINEAYIYYIIFSDFVSGSTEEEKNEIFSGKMNKFGTDTNKDFGDVLIQVCYDLYFDKKGKCYKFKYEIYNIYGDEEIEIEDAGEECAERFKKEITEFLLHEWYEV